MFTHLKYMAGISLLTMIIGGILIHSYADRFKEMTMLQSASSQIEATVASYSSSVWRRYADELLRNPQSPYLASFRDETKRFFQSHSLAKITIFSPDVSKLYYGSGDEYITLDGSTRVTLYSIEKVRKAIAVRRTLKDVQLNNSPDQKRKRSMVQAIVPIMRGATATPEALVEIYDDITPKWESLNKRLQIFMVSVIGAFALWVGVLLFTARRAESIITRQHEVNLELIAAAAQAEAQSRDKSQFLASVSHELRTPLNAIIGFSEIIRSEAKHKLEKIYQEYIEDIYASGKHLLSLINDILDFSKAEAGKLQIEWAETDVTKIISNSLRMVMPRAEAAQVTLVEETPSQHLVIVTDPKKLKQVLLNVLSNAVKFTPAGGEVRCHSWTDVVNSEVNIEVHDTGIGIAPKDISRVMTPFGQVDSALSRKYEGTGLGLPLSKKFVESMGGVFAIASEPKIGTTITITLPKAPPGWGTDSMNTTNSNPASAPDVPSEHN